MSRFRVVVYETPYGAGATRIGPDFASLRAAQREARPFQGGGSFWVEIIDLATSQRYTLSGMNVTDRCQVGEP